MESFYFSSFAFPSELEVFLRQTQREMYDSVCASNFLQERKPFHITFQFFGKNFNIQTKNKEEIQDNFLSLSEEDRTISLKNFEIFQTKKDNLLVCTFNVPLALKKFKKEMDDKLLLKDHINEYNPHITLGKFKKYNFCT